MSNDTKDASSGNDLLKNSSLYREFQAEREEILRHKWIESEKAGRDIGFERALTDWIVKHRSKWRKDPATVRINPINRTNIASFNAIPRGCQGCHETPTSFCKRVRHNAGLAFFMPESTLILNASAIQRALTRIAHEIAERNDASAEVVVIGIQRGGVRLARAA